MPDSVAIVTGASSGIGEATAVRLAREFAAVVLVARGDMAEVAGKVEAAGSRALTIEADLRAPEGADKIVVQALANLGRIDAVLNIAGAVAATDLFEMTDEQWEDALALKFHGARRLTLRTWGALKAAKGTVIFISGNAAVVPRAGSAAVGTINAAVAALAKAFADRGLEDGVQVNSVSPGAILTGRRVAMLEKVARAKQVDLDEAKTIFLKQAGISRFGTPEEVAELMALTVSERLRWLTGTVLRMDGGEVKSI